MRAPGSQGLRANEVAVIGAQPQVAGYALAGARVYVADVDEQVRTAWRQLPDTVAVVLLTEAAAQALSEERHSQDGPLSAVIPP